MSDAEIQRLLERLLSVGGQLSEHQRETIARILNSQTDEIPFLFRQAGLSLEEGFAGRQLQPGSNLDRQDLHNKDFTDAKLVQVSIAGSNLNGASLVRADLTASMLDQSTFIAAKLYQADLTSASARYTNFTNAKMQHAKLVGTDLTGANFAYATLQHCKFRDARLHRVVLQGANLSSAEFRNADLSGANLQGANLYGADLSHALMRRVSCLNVSFESCAVEGTRFDASTGITQEQKRYLQRQGAVFAS